MAMTEKIRKKFGIGRSMERDILSALKETKHVDPLEQDLMAALMEQVIADAGNGMQAALMEMALQEKELLDATPVTWATIFDDAIRRRAYDPERAVMWQSFMEVYQVPVIRKIINEEFGIMYSYLRSRLKKEYAKIGHDDAARTNARAEDWTETTNRIRSGQHVHTPDWQELASNALPRIWRKCKSARFLKKCFDRGMAPIVVAVCNAANNVIGDRYGANSRNTSNAANEAGLPTSQFADGSEETLMGRDEPIDILDALIGMEERGEINFAPRRHWGGYSLETQVGGLVAAILE